MRYRHQAHQNNVPLQPGIEEISPLAMEKAYDRFDRLYEETDGPGAGYREAGKEIMAFRVAATGRLKRPTLKGYPLENKSADYALQATQEFISRRKGLRAHQDL